MKEKYQELLGGWRPGQTNGYELYKAAGNDWTKIDISQLKTISWEDSWIGMPKEAIEYLKTLPEFDAELFTRITCLEIDNISMQGKKVSVIIDGTEYDIYFST